jgi:hypothetical protein
MRRLISSLLPAALLLATAAPARPYTLQFTDSTGATPVRWTTTPVTISLSTSLQNPPPSIQASGAEVVLAARRALARWANAANIEFNVVTSTETDVNVTGSDGVSLITVADTGVNRSFFTGTNPGLTPGKARVVRSGGSITEADLAINPVPTRLDENGQQVQSFFSVNGAPGSYDLESTFVHEIGHMLGLDHSGVLGATMQPRQGTNGTYDLPNFTTRTLSSDDVAGVRALYGPARGLGSIEGTVRYNDAVNGPAAFGAHVWAEDVATGRVVAGNIALPSGFYRISNLPPGQYRLLAEYLDEPVNVREIASRSGAYAGLAQNPPPPFVTTEVGLFTVNADQTTSSDPTTSNPSTTFSVPGTGAGPVPFNAQMIGVNSQLSTVAVPVVPGRRAPVFVSGDNILLTTDVQAQSPFFTVSNLRTITGFGIPTVGFDVETALTAAPGEYSVRLLSSAGQVAYVSGGLTVDPPAGFAPGDANLIDDTTFFVAQHYRDFFLREPDAGGLAFWRGQVEACGADAACRRVRRVNVSAAFFLSIEFQETGYLVYRTHKAAFGDLPGLPVPVRFTPFFADTARLGRGVVVGIGDWETRLEQNKREFAREFVQRPEFLARYPTTLGADAFVDALNQNASAPLSADERNALVAQLAPAPADPQRRADVLRAVAEDADLRRSEFNKAFVLLQYFGYLRRDPDDAPDSDFAGFNFWLAQLNRFGGNFEQAEMVRAFIESIEYRRRFGL